MDTNPTISRREFIKVAAVAGTGLVIGVYLPGCSRLPTATPERAGTPTVVATAAGGATPSLPGATPEPTLTPEAAARFEPNLFIQIDSQGMVTIRASKPELGQGVRTALPMIVADELEVDWSAVRVEQGGADRGYGDQSVGGSDSVSNSYLPLRRAGAVAREMLIAAAAQTWSVQPDECYAQSGTVVHRPSERRLPYGELVELAATLPVPKEREVPLKDASEFRIIGQRIGRVDNPQIVDGSARYSWDVQLPGMLVATVARCPVFGGKLLDFDPAPAEAVPGVRFILPVRDGVAVVADNTWAAIRGRRALPVTWDEGENADLSSDGLRQGLAEQAGGGAGGMVEGSTVTAWYEIPFLAHAAMEPISCTADVRSDSCTVWVPTQSPQEVKDRVTSLTRLLSNAVTVHVLLVGGAFGRRIAIDYVAAAVELSQQVGAPIKVVWTREDDIQHDLYHPLSVNRASGAADQPGQASVRSHAVESTVPTTYWRSVTNIPDALAHECLLDELAIAAGRDPVELRLSYLRDRFKPVLQLAAEKAGWASPLAAEPGSAQSERRGRGVAFHVTWGVTPVAQVAEVSVSDDGKVRVRRVVCAVDCGTVINPDMVEAQMEGGIAFGLSAVLKGEITVQNGRVVQSNFHDYPILRIDEMPVVEVYILSSDAAPQGVGEMGVPPIIPAVLNAVYAATGVRIRRIPIRSDALRV